MSGIDPQHLATKHQQEVVKHSQAGDKISGLKKSASGRAWPEFVQELKPDLGWARIYWVVGTLPNNCKRRNEVTDPPNGGFSHCFVMPLNNGHTKLFCPYSLQSYIVSDKSSEFWSLMCPGQPYRPDFMADLVLKNWRQCEKFGFQRDFDTAAKVMHMLGLKVPVRQVLAAAPGSPESTPGIKRGGKQAEPALLKRVKRTSRKGEVLSWFMEEFEPRPIREAMAQFNTTRSNILTVLHGLHKEHGIGYTLAGDTAEITLPSEGSKELFC